MNRSRSNWAARPISSPRPVSSTPANASSRASSRGASRTRGVEHGVRGGEQRQVQRDRLLAAGQPAVPGPGQRLLAALRADQLEHELAPPAVVEHLGEQFPVRQLAVPRPGGLDLRGEVGAHPGQRVRAEPGGVGVQQPAHLPLLVVEMRRRAASSRRPSCPTTSSGDRISRVHRADQVPGVHGAVVDLLGEPGQQRVLEDALLATRTAAAAGRARAAAIRDAKAPTGSGPCSSAIRTTMTPSAPSHSGW